MDQKGRKCSSFGEQDKCDNLVFVNQQGLQHSKDSVYVDRERNMRQPNGNQLNNRNGFQIQGDLKEHGDILKKRQRRQNSEDVIYVNQRSLQEADEDTLNKPICPQSAKSYFANNYKGLQHTQDTVIVNRNVSLSPEPSTSRNLSCPPYQTRQRSVSVKQSQSNSTKSGKQGPGKPPKEPSSKEMQQQRSRNNKNNKRRNGRKTKRLNKADKYSMESKVGGSNNSRIPIIGQTIAELFQFKIKERHDTTDDQFSRIIMVKMLLISSLITSMQYYYDKVRCVSPLDKSINMEFVRSACWIKGFYIYSELVDRLAESGYYGIPKDVEIDGIMKNGKLCRRLSKTTDLYDEDCRALTKTYYFHYQYLPFYIASLAIIYYAPYIFFRLLNHDLVSLKLNIKEPNDVDSECIVDNFFNYDANGGIYLLRLKVFGTIAIKFMYVAVNLLGFLFTDLLFNNKYANYGINWIRWYQLNNTLAFDTEGYRGYPKPGNVLLPSMAYCDFYEGTSHKTKTYINTHRIICEISSHIHYQYVLIVLWFLFVTSIFVSTGGLLHHMTTYCIMCFDFILRNRKRRNQFYRTCKGMTVREIEYMKIIRRLNIPLYKDVLELIQREKEMGKYAINNNFTDSENVLESELRELNEFDQKMNSEYLKCNSYM